MAIMLASKDGIFLYNGESEKDIINENLVGWILYRDGFENIICSMPYKCYVILNREYKEITKESLITALTEIRKMKRERKSKK